MHEHPTIDIVLCSDRHQFVGILAVIRSIVLHAEHPEAVFFHLLTGPGESGEITTLILREFPRPAFRWEVKEFRPESAALERYLRVGIDEWRGENPYTSMLLNYSRFYLDRIFPGIDKIVYLDPDIVVRADVADLFREASLSHHEIAAVPRKGWGVPCDKGSAHLREIDFGSPGFNAGVFVADLSKWRENDVVSQLEHWMNRWSEVKEETSENIFYYGSQIVMIATFHGKFQALDPGWNVIGLGDIQDLLEDDLEAAKILHWSGAKKPWKPEGLYKKYWEQYDD